MFTVTNTDNGRIVNFDYETMAVLHTALVVFEDSTTSKALQEIAGTVMERLVSLYRNVEGVKSADPELERLLAEEEEIERNAKGSH